MTTRSILMAFTAASALVGLGSAGALAQDSKSFPGTMCQALGGAQNLYYGSFGVANRNTTARAAVCPLVRDRVTVPAVSIEVEVRDRHATENIRCQARSVSPTGVAGWAQLQSTAGTGFQTLSFDGITAPDWGAYAVTCALPGMTNSQPSYIATYRITEP